MTELLGARRFQPETKLRTGVPGVATGLAWTPVGGDVLFIEAIAVPGDGKLQVTGQLGDVMKESAAAALSYVKQRFGEELGVDWFREHDIHLHVPAGAIPKDGPSAGITMATALASLVTGRPVRADTAMTGEITLTGRVLPIGGLKEKALAAQRAEITRVIAPKRNEPDLEEFPDAPEEGHRVRLPRDGRRGAGGGARAREARRPGPACARRVSSAQTKQQPSRRVMGTGRAAKAGAGAYAAGRAARENIYVQRLIDDQDLRENLRTAYESARKAYARMSNGKGPAKALMEDKKVQRELREAATSLRDAADTLRAPTRRKRRRGRLLVIGIVGAGLAIALSEPLRKKVLDALFGAEEEFEYTSTHHPGLHAERAGRHWHGLARRGNVDL